MHPVHLLYLLPSPMPPPIGGQDWVELRGSGSQGHGCSPGQGGVGLRPPQGPAICSNGPRLTSEVHTWDLGFLRLSGLQASPLGIRKPSSSHLSLGTEGNPVGVRGVCWDGHSPHSGHPDLRQVWTRRPLQPHFTSSPLFMEQVHEPSLMDLLWLVGIIFQLPLKHLNPDFFKAWSFLSLFLPF